MAQPIPELVADNSFNLKGYEVRELFDELPEKQIQESDVKRIGRYCWMPKSIPAPILRAMLQTSDAPRHSAADITKHNVRMVSGSGGYLHSILGRVESYWHLLKDYAQKISTATFPKSICESRTQTYFSLTGRTGVKKTCWNHV